VPDSPSQQALDTVRMMNNCHRSRLRSRLLTRPRIMCSARTIRLYTVCCHGDRARPGCRPTTAAALAHTADRGPGRM